MSSTTHHHTPQQGSSHQQKRIHTPPPPPPWTTIVEWQKKNYSPPNLPIQTQSPNNLEPETHSNPKPPKPIQLATRNTFKPIQICCWLKPICCRPFYRNRFKPILPPLLESAFWSGQERRESKGLRERTNETFFFFFLRNRTNETRDKWEMTEKMTYHYLERRIKYYKMFCILSYSGLYIQQHTVHGC